MTKHSSGHYRFRKHDSIGAADAENDERFLSSCFEDTGDLATLSSLTHPQRIVLGRTGSGKSALLWQLRQKNRVVIPIEPESLSMNYIANSDIIQFLSHLGINLDPFYKLLWRHVFAITLLQERYDIRDEATAKASFLSRLFESAEAARLRQVELERRRKAVEYLTRWGGNFWKDVDVRTKEITSTFENEFKSRLATSAGSELGAKLGPLKAVVSGNAEAALDDLRRLSVDEKAEVVHRAQEVVNEIQVKELTGMLDFLDEVLAGATVDYYIVIDRLDEAWVDDRLHYRLVKALVDTVREFGKVHKAKIIIALRIDLIERVFQDTKSESGFQEEKYRSLYLPLRWSREQLISILNKRIAELIRDRYTGYQPSCDDILPKHLVKRGQAVDYILDRTWLRPRDIIAFFNACISRAEGKAQFTKEIVSDAEGEYSRGRLSSILSEWHALYPHLDALIHGVLGHRAANFSLSDVTESALDELCLQIVCADGARDSIFVAAEERTNGTLSHDAVRAQFAFVLYRTGAIGLKTDKATAPRWADNESYSVSRSEITDSTQISIHPGLWRVLGITPPP